MFLLKKNKNKGFSSEFLINFLKLYFKSFMINFDHYCYKFLKFNKTPWECLLFEFFKNSFKIICLFTCSGFIVASYLYGWMPCLYFYAKHFLCRKISYFSEKNKFLNVHNLMGSNNQVPNWQDLFLVKNLKTTENMEK